jgi:hypothetical protein
LHRRQKQQRAFDRVRPADRICGGAHHHARDTWDEPGSEQNARTGRSRSGVDLLVRGAASELRQVRRDVGVAEAAVDARVQEAALGLVDAADNERGIVQRRPER